MDAIDAIDVFPVTWSVGDTGPGDACRITACGKTPDGQSACVHVAFTPFFYVLGPKGFSEPRCRPLMVEWAQRYGALLDKCRVVRRRSIWGFRNGEQRLFVQLVFPSLQAFRRARYGLARDKQETYEGGVDPVVRLFHLRGLGPCRWMRVARHHPPRAFVADVDVEVECSFLDVAPSKRADRPPLVFGSWDIECRSASGGFPVADRPEDRIIQISTAFQRYGEPEPYARTVVCLHETSPVDGVQISWHQHEHQVINEWARLVREHKTDVMLGYNTLQFDWPYVQGRAEVLVDDDTGEPLVDLELLGRMVEGGGEAREFEMNSGAFGQNKFFILQTPGVQQLDLLQWMRREHKLSSYGLDAVSRHFLGDAKLDLPAAQIFAKFLGTPDDRADIAAYAVRDTELPLRLMNKLCVYENLAEMANAVRVPMDYLLTRGQQIKVMSCVLGKAREMGYVLPDNKAIGMPPGKKFEGATVLDAKRGAYFDVVSGLDYASLVRRPAPARRRCAPAPWGAPRPRAPPAGWDG